METLAMPDAEAVMFGFTPECWEILYATQPPCKFSGTKLFAASS